MFTMYFVVFCCIYSKYDQMEHCYTFVFIKWPQFMIQIEIRDFLTCFAAVVVILMDKWLNWFVSLSFSMTMFRRYISKFCQHCTLLNCVNTRHSCALQSPFVPCGQNWSTNNTQIYSNLLNVVTSTYQQPSAMANWQCVNKSWLNRPYIVNRQYNNLRLAIQDNTDNAPR
jgi:hypothetical protein